MRRVGGRLSSLVIGFPPLSIPILPNSAGSFSALTFNPHSSRVSLLAQSRMDSPSLTLPPNPFHFPFPKPRFFIPSKISPLVISRKRTRVNNLFFIAVVVVFVNAQLLSQKDESKLKRFPYGFRRLKCLISITGVRPKITDVNPAYFVR